ncbi:MAG: ABC transporter ATP-binding protein/permease [Clostridiales bacterium]|jgi:ABC-type multidrug transport system fused ATPase/permease subunit|nr:ABC transporter ATP-binding protein/permease [Clostridiales bacterium]
MKIFWEAIRSWHIRYARFLLIYIIAAAVTAFSNVYVAKTQGEIGQAAFALNRQLVIDLLLVMTFFTVIKVIFSALSVLLSKRFIGNTDYKIKNNFAKHFTFISFSDVSKKNSGELLSLYTNDLQDSVDFITTNTLEQVTQIVVLIISIIYMALINPLFTFIYFVSFPILVFMQSHIARPIGIHMQNVSKYRAEFNAIVNDSLQNPSTVIVYSLEDTMEKRYLSSYEQYYKVFMRYVTTLLKLAISGILASFLPTLILVVIVGYNVANGSMMISEFIAFVTIAEASGSWLTMLSQNLARLQAGNAAAKRILEHLTEPFENLIGESDHNVPPVSNAPAITFQDVKFGYTDAQEVLHSLSFTIPSCTRTAVVGTSGSGKSTIIKLIMSLYESSSGKISILGESVNYYGRKNLRELLSYVPQDSFLFPISIKENIIGNKAYEPQKFEKVCIDAGIHEFIQSLPDGSNTVLSESSQNISGGQQQRIAIARALYHDSPIILLDESTSALDPITEKAVLDSFYESTKEKTTLVVAHRMSAITSCDLIIVLDDGYVVEMGTHSELMRNQSFYTKLFEGENRHEAQ